MADLRNVFLAFAIIGLVLVGLYLINPNLFNTIYYREGFQATMGTDSTSSQPAGMNEMAGATQAAQNTATPSSAGGDATSSGLPGTAPAKKDASGNGVAGFANEEGFANVEDVTGPAAFGSAEAPAGCYPRDQLTPSELLPRDGNSVWAQQNPMGTGSLKGKNFLSAGALIGINTVGQSMRNANLQLRSEPPNPQVPVSVFNNSTIEPDMNRRDFEVN